MNDCKYYKLEFKAKTKNNKTFLRHLRKKSKKKNDNNKYQILNIKI